MEATYVQVFRIDTAAWQEGTEAQFLTNTVNNILLGMEHEGKQVKAVSVSGGLNGQILTHRGSWLITITYSE